MVFQRFESHLSLVTRRYFRERGWKRYVERISRSFADKNRGSDEDSLVLLVQVSQERPHWEGVSIYRTYCASTGAALGSVETFEGSPPRLYKLGVLEYRPNGSGNRVTSYTGLSLAALREILLLLLVQWIDEEDEIFLLWRKISGESISPGGAINSFKR